MGMGRGCGKRNTTCSLINLLTMARRGFMIILMIVSPKADILSLDYLFTVSLCVKNGISVWYLFIWTGTVWMTPHGYDFICYLFYTLFSNWFRSLPPWQGITTNQKITLAFIWLIFSSRPVVRLLACSKTSWAVFGLAKTYLLLFRRWLFYSTNMVNYLPLVRQPSSITHNSFLTYDKIATKASLPVCLFIGLLLFVLCGLSWLNCS